MLSINMRIFKTVLLVLVLGSAVQCLPLADESSTPSAESSTGDDTAVTPTLSSTGDHYDQRQNGSENYRVFVDGVAFVFAPIEALLLAGATSGTGGTGNEPNLSILGQNGLEIMKPGTADKPKPDIEEPVKPAVAAPKSNYRPGLRLANLIVPLLRRIRND